VALALVAGDDDQERDVRIDDDRRLLLVAGVLSSAAIVDRLVIEQTG